MAVKILRARFQNFRLLRDVEIDFSTDADKPLTVIRAENESGKTTLLVGLQWGLYGEDALPGGRDRDFRLHPINWEASAGQPSISVEIDLELSSFHKTRQGKILNRPEVFRVSRMARETLTAGKWGRDATSLTLHRRTSDGWEREIFPQRILDEHLSLDLREVFFTDGDDVLRFIESTDASSRRGRVENAIRSLLALDTIEAALSHIKTTSRKANAAAKNIGANESIEEVATELDQVESEREQHKRIISDAAAELSVLDAKLAEINAEISKALMKGDKADLERRRARNAAASNEVDKDKKAAEEAHSELFRSMEFSRDIIAAPLQKAMDMLADLRSKEQFPKASIPLLQEILQARVCFCGEAVHDADASSEHRRQRIQDMIENSRKADELQSVLTEVYFATNALSEISPAGASTWSEQFEAIAKRRDDLEERIDELGKEASHLDAQIRQLGDVDIALLQDSQRKFAAMRDSKRDARVRSETMRANLLDQSESLKRRRDSLLREQTKGANILANLNVTQDVKDVLERAYSRMTHEELNKVSNLMNGYFLEMIGSDPEQSSIIRRAAISERFDILVYGTDDRELNPDRDINGASRRALTLAFIMALTKVSEVAAPNIIDTPLGMMSGYVKRAVLKTLARESSQPILFLTRSEIAECEDIIDETAGRVITLTNTAHYPLMLEFPPDAAPSQVVRCDCDHHADCRICRRRAYEPIAAN